MKKYLLFVLVAISMTAFSCKSTEQEDVKTVEVLTPAQQNERFLTQIENSRSMAMNAGADKYYADQFKAIDADLKKLKEKVTGSEADFYEELKELNYRYFILNRACELRNGHKQ